MTSLRELTNFLNEHLEIDSIKDTSWNGLQVEGRQEINKIVGAVDAGIEIFEEASRLNADIIITHHGHFWKPVNPAIKEGNKERIQLLLDNNLSLYCAHLPLDRHKELGNNAQILKILSAGISDEFIIEGGKNVSWIGTLSTEKDLSEIVDIIKEKINPHSKVLPFGKEKIKTIAVCTGAGNYANFYEAAEKADLFITGETLEVYQTAKDLRMNVIFAGHYATEVGGIRALLQFLQEKYGIETTFIDSPTGI